MMTREDSHHEQIQIRVRKTQNGANHWGALPKRASQIYRIPPHSLHRRCRNFGFFSIPILKSSSRDESERASERAQPQPQPISPPHRRLPPPQIYLRSSRMFWHMSPLSASSPVEVILDKEDYSLEELLDEEEIIQECKALNSRLINFLRDRAQVEQLLRYIVEESPEDAESKRAFKFPFIACEIFTCEIDVILKTLVEEEELMNLLFSFLEPKHSHSTLLAGYFSKVVVCLMVRKMAQLMNYVQAHQDVIQKLVDLIGITSIMEVLVRLVGADDHVYSNFTDVMQWLANGNLLGMIVDKLNPSNPPEVHANAAETLCAVTQNAPSALASKLSTPSFVTRIFSHALEDSQSRSGLVHSLSVCISLMDPKRLSSPLLHSFRSQHMYESPVTVHPDTITAMLPKLGDLLMLLDVSSDQKILPTTYGELRPPLGKHRLKIVEFFAVLLRTGSEIAEKELVCVGAIQRILDLFFGYPFHNALHHLVEGIITSCLESKHSSIVDHLFQECNLVGRILQTDKLPILSSDLNQPTVLTSGRQAPRVGNLGHLTRISNKLVQLRNGNSQIQAYLQDNAEWVEWEANVLQKRNALENIHHWACGRPTSLHDRARDSDDDDGQDRDYDVGALANNLSLAFRYNIYENDDTEEVRGSIERDDEDVYFDDDSAEVVISSLRLGDEHESLFTNANWFAFEDESLSSSEKISEINSNETANTSSSSNDEDVVIGEADDLVESAPSVNDGTLGSTPGFSEDPTTNNAMNEGDINSQDEKASVSGDVGLFKSDAITNKNESISDGAIPDCVGLHETPDMQVSQLDGNSLKENGQLEGDLSTHMNVTDSTSNSLPNGKIDEPMDTTCAMDSENGSAGTDASASLFEEDVEFVVGEPEGVEKAMEHALKEGTVGEAGCLKRSLVPQVPEMSEEDREGMLEFNDTNYWRVDKEIAVVQQ